jgi:hypothetical protein
MVDRFKSAEELREAFDERWEKWRPALHQAHGPGVYPLFERRTEKLRRAQEGRVAAR